MTVDWGTMIDQVSENGDASTDGLAASLPASVDRSIGTLIKKPFSSVKKIAFAYNRAEDVALR